MVCLWLHRGSNCLQAQTMDVHIMHCGIISSHQSAVTSEIVKHFQASGKQHCSKKGLHIKLFVWSGGERCTQTGKMLDPPAGACIHKLPNLYLFTFISFWFTTTLCWWSAITQHWFQYSRQYMYFCSHLQEHHHWTCCIRERIHVLCTPVEVLFICIHLPLRQYMSLNWT